MAISQDDISQLKVLIFGAGAIGTYIGGSLILNQQNVVFIEQEKVAEKLHERGLRLGLSLDTRRKEKDAFLIDPASFVIASSLEDALRYGPFDVAIYALKSFDTAGALEGIQPFVDRMPPILCLSNGVDNEPAIVKVLGRNKVIFGTVTTAIGRHSAGDIVLEKLRGVGIGSSHPLSERLILVFNNSFLNAQPFSDPKSMKWSKMLTNLLANPVSAILDMNASDIYSHRGLYKLEISILRECLAVMKAQNTEVVDLPGTPVRALGFATKLPLWLSKPFLGRAAGSGRGGKMPSFHIDLHAGRGKSEVDYLHGAVVRAGKKARVPTPVNKLLTDILMGMTNGKIPLGEYSRQPEKLLAKL